MICTDDFGPGQNIRFFLITTALDVNPKNGTVGYENYEFLKSVITENADLLFEEPNLRYNPGKDVSQYLQAYDSSPRTIYQVLFGTARYSNAWTPEMLAEDINNKSVYFVKRPKDGEFSVNPYEFYNKSCGLYKCVQDSTSALVWDQIPEFKISEKMPGINDGYDGSVWGVLTDGRIDVYVKNAFQWTKLEDYVTAKNSNLSVSDQPPSLVAGNYWFKIDDVLVYQYSNHAWSSGLTALYSNTLSGSWNNGDKILNYKNSSITLFEFNNGKYKKKIISNYIIRNQNLNTTFKSGSDNNFIIESCNEALVGGITSPLFEGGNGMVKVYQEGVFKGEFQGLDFYGPDIVVDGDNASISFSSLSTGNSIVDTQFYEVLSNNQTVFNAPVGSISMVEASVNGVDENSFTFNDTLQTFTFNPVLAGYDLEIGDTIILVYLKPTM